VGISSGQVNYSCSLSATNEWFKILDGGADVGAIFFDLSKAFDSVPHKALLEKLKDIGLNRLLLKWITDYYK